MEIYRALRPFSAFNEDDEPQLVQESLLLLDGIHFEWVFFLCWLQPVQLAEKFIPAVY